MGKRFAIVIGVAAAGVMALGAQTATSSTVGSVDTTPPDLQLSGPKRQRVVRTFPADVKVKVSCGDEECTAHLNEGKLTKVKEDRLRPSRIELTPIAPIATSPPPYSDVVIPSGRTGKAIWELTKLQRKQVRKAILDEGKNVQAKVSVEATDAAGNVATANRTIRLTESRPGDTCSDEAATIVGTGAGESLTGTPQRDVIKARGGNDTIRGVQGRDIVCAGGGNDTVRGGGGGDRLKGGNGRDLLKGGGGDDDLLGGLGRNRCKGGPGRDTERSC